MNEQLRKAILEATDLISWREDGVGDRVVNEEDWKDSQAKLLRVIEVLVIQRNEYIRANWEHSPDELNEIAEMKLRDAELIAAIKQEGT